MQNKLVAKFQAFARTMTAPREKKRVASAALDHLAGVFKTEELRVKIQENPDLLFWASNLILLDEANLNDDCVRKEDAIKFYKSFEYKFTDVEHDRTTIVGAIYNAGFSLYDSNEMITEIEAIATVEPVQLVVGGYLWRAVDSELCEAVELASIESGPHYGDVSTSFELAFDYYDIAIGKNGDRNVNNARIIKHGDADFDKYNAMLRHNKGSGKDGDDIVFRVLSGDIIPLGAGIVSKPASGLKGVLAITGLQDIPLDTISAEKTKDEGVELISEAKSYTIAVDPNKNPEDKDNHTEQILSIKQSESSVTPITTVLPMKIKSFEELAQNWAEVKKLETAASVVADLQEVTEASIRKQIEEALAVKSEEYAAEQKRHAEALKSAEDAKKQIEEAKAAAEDKVKTLETTLATIQTELEQIKSNEEAKAKQEKFDARMNQINDEFELDAEDLGYLTPEIVAAESDEAFAAIVKKMEKLMHGKKRNKANCDKEKDMKEKMSKAAIAAAANVDVAAAVQGVTEIVQPGITTGTETTMSLAEKVRKSFGEGMLIGDVPAKDVISKKE